MCVAGACLPGPLLRCCVEWLHAGWVGADHLQRWRNGGRTIKLDVQIDPSIIGGMTIRVGSVQIDSSLSTKLNKLSLALKSSVTGAAA